MPGIVLGYGIIAYVLVLNIVLNNCCALKLSTVAIAYS